MPTVYFLQSNSVVVPYTMYNGSVRVPLEIYAPVSTLDMKLRMNSVST